MDPLFAAYFSFALIFALTPGATTALVARNALAGGRRAGLATAAGAAAANASYATASSLGLAVVLVSHPSAFAAVRAVGALYLGWLGAQSLWRAMRHHDGGLKTLGDLDDSAEREVVTSNGALTAFRQGLTFNLLNPSIAGFYLTVVPSFMPDGGSATRFAFMAATHVVLAFGCHSMWALALDAARRTFKRPSRRRLLQAITGATLVGLAVRLLLRGAPHG